MTPKAHDSSLPKACVYCYWPSQARFLRKGLACGNALWKWAAAPQGLSFMITLKVWAPAPGLHRMAASNVSGRASNCPSPASLHWYWVPAHCFTPALDLTLPKSWGLTAMEHKGHSAFPGVWCSPGRREVPPFVQRVVGSRWLVSMSFYDCSLAALVLASYLATGPGARHASVVIAVWGVHLNSFSDLGSRITLSGTAPWPYSLDNFTPSEAHTDSCLVLGLLLYYN